MFGFRTIIGVPLLALLLLPVRSLSVPQPGNASHVLQADTSDDLRKALTLVQPGVATEIHLDARSYQISAPLLIGGNTRLVGIPDKTILGLEAGSAGPILRAASGASYIDLVNLTFDGNKSAQTSGGTGVDLAGTHYAHLADITFRNFHGVAKQPGGAALSLSNTDHAVVQHCRFIDNGTPGQWYSDGLFLSGTNGTVTDSTADGNTDTGFATQHANHVLFARNSSSRNGNGFAAGAFATDLAYQDNAADGNLFGFYFRLFDGHPGIQQVRILRNKARQNSAGGIVVIGDHATPMSGFEITSNDVRQTQGRGRLTDGVNGVYLKDVSKVQVENNSVTSSDNHGILIIGGTDGQLIGNTVWDNSQRKPLAAYGILIKDGDTQSARITISRNTVFDDQATPTQLRGIVSGSKDVVIEQNRVYGNAVDRRK